MADQTHLEKNVEHFNSTAATWDAVKPHVAKLAREAGAAIPAAVPLSTNAIVMDFGCGTGIVSEILSPQVGRVVGVDAAPQMIATYQAKAAALGLNNMSGVCLNILDKAKVEQAVSEGVLPSAFTFIFSHMCFHHVEDVPQVLSCLSELLQPTGQLLVSDLLKTPVSKEFHAAGTHTVAYPGGFSEDQLKDMFAGAGLDLLKFDSSALAITKEGWDWPVFLAVGQKHSSTSA